jgi:hypothetical protein
MSGFLLLHSQSFAEIIVALAFLFAGFMLLRFSKRKFKRTGKFFSSKFKGALIFTGLVFGLTILAPPTEAMVKGWLESNVSNLIIILTVVILGCFLYFSGEHYKKWLWFR